MKAQVLSILEWTINPFVQNVGSLIQHHIVSNDWHSILRQMNVDLEPVRSDVERLDKARNGVLRVVTKHATMRHQKRAILAVEVVCTRKYSICCNLQGTEAENELLSEHEF